MPCWNERQACHVNLHHRQRLCPAEMGSLHHVAWQAKLEAKGSNESRNGIGSRWGAVAGRRPVWSGCWSAGRYSDGEHGTGNYSR
jgi:hypothetical protein